MWMAPNEQQQRTSQYWLTHAKDKGRLEILELAIPVCATEASEIPYMPLGFSLI